VLPVALLFTSDGLLSITGGLAAAIAVGAFLGQVHAIVGRSSDEGRRRRTAQGGVAGALVLIGLLLVSKSGS
jgi:VIT1/CCC1 family predicted Fe2+/Mn2+ transporter